ncbi:MAG: hypothetical protein RL088_1704 [Verrucomicrobiota bacterium]|jgi:uncharacterized membrane protein YhdT
MDRESICKKLDTRLGWAFSVAAMVIVGELAEELTLGVRDWAEFLSFLLKVGIVGFLVGGFVIWPLKEAQKRTGIPIWQILGCLFGLLFAAAICWAVVKQVGFQSVRYRWDEASRVVEFTRAGDPIGFWAMPVAMGLFGLFIFSGSVGMGREAWKKLRARKVPTQDSGSPVNPAADESR